jgi:hypothetical protein
MDAQSAGTFTLVEAVKNDLTIRNIPQPWSWLAVLNVYGGCNSKTDPPCAAGSAFLDGVATSINMQLKTRYKNGWRAREV